jgi:hypothetical protein
MLRQSWRKGHTVLWCLFKLFENLVAHLILAQTGVLKVSLRVLRDGAGLLTAVEDGTAHLFSHDG